MSEKKSSAHRDEIMPEAKSSTVKVPVPFRGRQYTAVVSMPTKEVLGYIGKMPKAFGSPKWTEAVEQALAGL